MKKYFPLIVFCSLLLISCKEIINRTSKFSSKNNEPELIVDGDFKVIKVEDTYQLSVPKYMKKMNNLNDEASLQYANIYKEAYTIVIHENKQEFIDTFNEMGEYDDHISVAENYQLVQNNFFKESIDPYKTEHYGLTELNSYNARQVKYFAKVDGYDVAYIIGFIEGDENVFMIMNWTLKKHIGKYENTFEKINESFKLIKPKNDEIQ